MIRAEINTAGNSIPNVRILGFAGITALAIYFIDTLIPLGVATGVAYFVVVGIASFTKKSSLIWATALLCSMLVLVGFAISPQGGEPWKILTNRGLSIFVIVLTAFLADKLNRANYLTDQLEQVFRPAVESSPTAIIITNVDGEIILVNSEVERLFDYSREELFGKYVEVLMPERFRAKHIGFRNNFADHPASRKMGEGRKLFGRRKDGSEFPVEIGLNSIQTKQHRLVLSVISDITERMLIEEEREKARKKLSRINEELARSNKELDDFAYVASHDLKAPLLAIANLSAWIHEDAGELLPEDSKKHLKKLRQRTARMEKLLHDLLQYSRAGRVKSDIKDINTYDLIQDIIELHSVPEGFTFEVPADIPNLQSEHSPIHQIFFNLIGNAIKHHDREDGRIRVSWMDRGRFIEFSVSDDGPGIPPEYHEQVFQLFQTLKPRDEVEGSGMGLAIIKKLIHHYGGTIHLHSNEGSTFSFTWPKEMSLEPELENA